MARLVVLTDTESALGFALAGVEVFAVDDDETARARLVELLADPGVGLIAVGEGVMRRLDTALRRRLDTSQRPVVVSLPTGGPTTGFATRREYLAALVRRAVGFHITFPGEEAT
ncbi:MAG: V-type ATP synthase subunit F [Anaerolineae bacterium]